MSIYDTDFDETDDEARRRALLQMEGEQTLEPYGVEGAIADSGLRTAVLDSLDPARGHSLLAPPPPRRPHRTYDLRTATGRKEYGDSRSLGVAQAMDFFRPEPSRREPHPNDREETAKYGENSRLGLSPPPPLNLPPGDQPGSRGRSRTMEQRFRRLPDVIHEDGRIERGGVAGELGRAIQAAHGAEGADQEPRYAEPLPGGVEPTPMANLQATGMTPSQRAQKFTGQEPEAYSEEDFERGRLERIRRDVNSRVQPLGSGTQAATTAPTGPGAAAQEEMRRAIGASGLETAVQDGRGDATPLPPREDRPPTSLPQPEPTVAEAPPQVPAETASPPTPPKVDTAGPKQPTSPEDISSLLSLGKPGSSPPSVQDDPQAAAIRNIMAGKEGQPQAPAANTEASREDILRELLASPGRDVEERMLNRLRAERMLSGAGRIAAGLVGIGGGRGIDHSRIGLNSAPALQAISQAAALQQRDRQNRIRALSSLETADRRAGLTERGQDITRRGQDITRERYQDLADSARVQNQIRAQRTNILGESSRVRNAVALSAEQRQRMESDIANNLEDPNSAVSEDTARQARQILQAVANDPSNQRSASAQSLLQSLGEEGPMRATDARNIIDKFLDAPALTGAQMRERRRGMRRGGGGGGGGRRGDAMRQAYRAIAERLPESHPRRASVIGAVDGARDIDELRQNWANITQDIPELRQHNAMLARMGTSPAPGYVVNPQARGALNPDGIELREFRAGVTRGQQARELIKNITDLLEGVDSGDALAQLLQQHPDRLTRLRPLVQNLTAKVGQAEELGTLQQSDITFVQDMMGRVEGIWSFNPRAWNGMRTSLLEISRLSLQEERIAARNLGFMTVAEFTEQYARGRGGGAPSGGGSNLAGQYGARQGGN